MDEGLLSLKWNNHRTTFFHVLTRVRRKNIYNDVTLACDGKFYQTHKLVLSTCSEYFEQMFEQTQCKHPVIVLKDIKSEELEALLDYMYIGEVNVVQEKLSGLIKAAECLRIKGLAVPDEEPSPSKQSSREKRSSDSCFNSDAKRRRQEDTSSGSSNRHSGRNDERKKSIDSNKLRSNNLSTSSSNTNSKSTRENSEPRISPARESPKVSVKTEDPNHINDPEPINEVTIDEPADPVKQEPTDDDAVYLSDSNSATEGKDILMDNFADDDNQQHFMDELLGQSSTSDQGQMGDYGEGVGGASGSGQQHMVWTPHSTIPNTSTASPLWSREETQPFASNSSSVTSQSKKGHLKSRFVASGNELQDGAPAVSATRSNYDDGNSTIVVASDAYNSCFENSSSYATCQSEPAVVPFEQLGLSRCSNYTCPICGLKFANKSNFRLHYMIHTGEKPFLCSLCPYRARQSSDMLKHVKIRHSLSYLQLQNTDI